jgi:hypothetical protein
MRQYCCSTTTEIDHFLDVGVNILLLHEMYDEVSPSNLNASIRIAIPDS